MRFSRTVLLTALPALLWACSETSNSSTTASTAPPASAPAATPAAYTPPQPSTSPVARSIDAAAFSEPTAGSPAEQPQAQRDMFIRAQVLLARAHFSPGVIDGQDGGNLQNAVRAYEKAKSLPQDGKLDAEVFSRLTADAGPVMMDYQITADDVDGPFVSSIPKDEAEMAKLETLAYTSPTEALAEKFHMDEALLKALNPGVDFGAAGTKIVVAALGPADLPATVTRVVVDKADRQVRAYGEGDVLLATYPATVGSADRPAPSGEWAVRTIAPNPTYTYDPSRLTFGDSSQGKLTINAGPNNPVGSTWIDLTKDTYGIHGTPDPRLVGKTASHGCVRLTNWDAHQLSKAVKAGTKVVFQGSEKT